ncbi:MAG TPA: hypothetical protein VK154_20075 [Chitinophagales bacterium]|nr:hypothetical protein [Chitinophagales bacterium]
MKKFLLASLVAMTLLLPALNNTSNAASIFVQRVVNIAISGWTFFATSETADGTITRIEIYRLSTGERVRASNCNGTYECSVDLSGLPHGGYCGIIICQNVTVSKQFKL